MPAAPTQDDPSVPVRTTRGRSRPLGEGPPVPEGLTATQGVPIYYFYPGLNHLALAGKGARQAREKICADGHQETSEMGSFAPMNYAHRVHLLEAELARVLGQNAAAREHYDKAIQLARQHQFLNDTALASELAGRCHLEWGLTHVAQGYLRDAHDGYLQWGAHALVRQIEARFPQFIATPGFLLGTREVRSADWRAGTPLTSVLRPSQLISSQIELEPLVRSLMNLAMENSGARRACLLFEREQRLFIEAEVTADRPEVTVQAEAADTLQNGRPRLPLSIINFVIHTQESLLLDDATADPRFERDSDFIRLVRTRCSALLW